MRKNNGRKGFTLIELMIVIAIIIILAAVAIPNYLKMTSRARTAAIQSDLKALATALETYKTDWGAYPPDTGTDPWETMKAELTADGATENASSETNLLGAPGGDVYITPQAIKALEDKVDSHTYSVEDTGDYTITVKADIDGTKEFTMTSGGTITISG